MNRHHHHQQCTMCVCAHANTNPHYTTYTTHSSILQRIQKRSQRTVSVRNNDDQPQRNKPCLNSPQMGSQTNSLCLFAFGEPFFSNGATYDIICPVALFARVVLVVVLVPSFYDRTEKSTRHLRALQTCCVEGDQITQHNTTQRKTLTDTAR